MTRAAIDHTYPNRRGTVPALGALLRTSGVPNAARMTVELRTERLVGRPPTEDDLEGLARMWDDDRVTATLGGKRSRPSVEQILDRWQRHWDEHGFGPLVWHDARTGELVGWCGLQWTTVAGEQAIELLYATTAGRWGEGLTTESAREVLRWADDDLLLDELVCFTMTTNLASQSVMQKCGFGFEREIEHADLPHVLYRRSRPTVASASGQPLDELDSD